MSKQLYVRVQIYDTNAAGQKYVGIMATGADGIRFWTEDDCLVDAAGILTQALPQIFDPHPEPLPSKFKNEPITPAVAELIHNAMLDIMKEHARRGTISTP